MRVARYSSEVKAHWDSHVETARNSHFMHRRDYMEYHADRFTDHSLMVYGDDNTLLAVFPANARDGVLYSHQGLSFGGLILPASARAAEVLGIMEALVLYAKETGFTEIIYKAIPTLYHVVPSAEDEYALFRVGAILNRVDIATSIELAHPLPFSTLRVRGAKKATKAGITVRTSDDYSAFHRIVATILQDKYEAQVTHSESELVLLSSRFPDNMHLHAAYEGEEMLAGVVIFETSTVAHAQYIGASARGRELGALDLIFMTLISQNYNHKRYFDFGISTEDAGRTLNTGLIGQKEGFGGRGVAHRFYSIPTR